MITITFNCASHEEAAAIMAKVRATAPKAVSEATVQGTDEKPKRTRRAKLEPVEELEEMEELEEAPEVSEEELDFNEEEEDEDGVVNEDELKKIKLALNTYAGKHGREKVLKVLMKFAKTSSEVKKSDLPKLLKALKI